MVKQDTWVISYWSAISSKRSGEQSDQLTPSGQISLRMRTSTNTSVELSINGHWEWFPIKVF